MNEIKCPECGAVIRMDDGDYASILQQVRTKEFEKELREQKTEAVRSAEAVKDKEIEKLNATIRWLTEKSDADLSAAAEKAEADRIKEVADIREKLARAEAEKEAAVQQAISEKEKEAASREKTILELQNKIDLMNGEFLLQQKQREDDHRLALRQKDDEIAYYKDLKARQSTKMIGETLEQHCEIEFNRIRAAAFPRAIFGKDNDAKSGSKGDYIFREMDESGLEYISIMFEMKNEADETATKHKNEDFLKKLDRDRTEKGCEYAVLVSMLEADSEYYNTGIVDVSYLYPKMYVIRPQFFIQLISLLRGAAQNSMQYRRELAAAKAQNLDVENFSGQLDDFKKRFSYSYQQASNRFVDAIVEIDKTISELQKVKQNLQKSADHLRHANNKAEDLSIRRLTAGSPSLAQKFEEAGISLD